MSAPVTESFVRPAPELTPRALSANVRAEIMGFASRANALANEVLSSESQTSSGSSRQRPVIIRNYYSSPLWYPFYQPVYVVGGGRSRRSDESNWHCLAGVGAAILGGIAIYATGTALNRFQDSDRELDDSYRFEDKLNGYRRTAAPADQALVEEARHTSSLKARICARIKNSALFDLTARISVFLSCGTIIGGALAAWPAAMTAGTVALLVVGSAMLFKWGYESSSKRHIYEAQALQASVRQLQQL